MKSKYSITLGNILMRIGVKSECYDYTGMTDISPAKRMSMANSLRYLEDMREKTLNMLKTDRYVMIIQG